MRPFGDATKVNDRRSHASDPHDAALRAAAKRALMFEPVSFTGVQAREVGHAFAVQTGKSGFTIVSAAILPKHVHLVVLRHHYRIEQVVNLLKGAATRRLVEGQMHQFQNTVDSSGARPSMWGRELRKIFLFTPEQVRSKIKYVSENPLKESKPEQRWSFVTAFSE